MNSPGEHQSAEKEADLRYAATMANYQLQRVR